MFRTNNYAKALRKAHFASKQTDVEEIYARGAIGHSSGSFH